MLTTHRRALEPWILLFAIGSQVARIAFGQRLDDDYVAMSAVTLVFLAGVVVVLARATHQGHGAMQVGRLR